MRSSPDSTYPPRTHDKNGQWITKTPAEWEKFFCLFNPKDLTPARCADIQRHLRFAAEAAEEIAGLRALTGRLEGERDAGSGRIADLEGDAILDRVRITELERSLAAARFSVARSNRGSDCGLFHCPLEEARELMPELPWDESPILDGVEYIVDVKVHKLMPNQWPCIPNWHGDFVPRDPVTLQERPDLIDPVQMFMWLSGPPFTEFRDGRKVRAREWIPFTQYDVHRGVAATEHCWRTFIRIAPADVMRVGLPNEEIPAPPEQWVRRHTQVYLDVNGFRW
jgi:hypothetical protein